MIRDIWASPRQPATVTQRIYIYLCHHSVTPQSPLSKARLNPLMFGSDPWTRRRDNPWISKMMYTSYILLFFLQGKPLISTDSPDGVISGDMKQGMSFCSCLVSTAFIMFMLANGPAQDT